MLLHAFFFDSWQRIVNSQRRNPRAPFSKSLDVGETRLFARLNFERLWFGQFFFNILQLRTTVSV